MRSILVILVLAMIPCFVDMNFQDSWFNMPVWLYYFILLHFILIGLMWRFVKARYNLMDGLAARASISSGFRAPSLAQIQ